MGVISTVKNIFTPKPSSPKPTTSTVTTVPQQKSDVTSVDYANKNTGQRVGGTTTITKYSGGGSSSSTTTSSSSNSLTQGTGTGYNPGTRVQEGVTKTVAGIAKPMTYTVQTVKAQEPPVPVSIDIADKKTGQRVGGGTVFIPRGNYNKADVPVIIENAEGKVSDLGTIQVSIEPATKALPGTTEISFKKDIWNNPSGAYYVAPYIAQQVRKGVTNTLPFTRSTFGLLDSAERSFATKFPNAYESVAKTALTIPVTTFFAPAFSFGTYEDGSAGVFKFTKRRTYTEVAKEELTKPTGKSTDANVRLESLFAKSPKKATSELLKELAKIKAMPEGIEKQRALLGAKNIISNLAQKGLIKTFPTPSIYTPAKSGFESFTINKILPTSRLGFMPQASNTISGITLVNANLPKQENINKTITKQLVINIPNLTTKTIPTSNEVPRTTPVVIPTSVSSVVETPKFPSPTVTTIVTPTIIPPRPIIDTPVIPPIILPNFSFSEGQGTRIYTGRQRTKYIPSYESFVFNIRGKAPKGLETGARTRPIPRGFNFAFKPSPIKFGNFKTNFNFKSFKIPKFKFKKIKI